MLVISDFLIIIMCVFVIYNLHIIIVLCIHLYVLLQRYLHVYNSPMYKHSLSHQVSDFRVDISLNYNYQIERIFTFSSFITSGCVVVMLLTSKQSSVQRFVLS